MNLSNSLGNRQFAVLNRIARAWKATRWNLAACIFTMVAALTFGLSPLKAQDLELPKSEQDKFKAQTAIWVLQDPVDKLVINLNGILSKKQKALLNSGFSTFSQLTTSYIGDTDKPIELYRVACTVKFDAWDEVYELARLDERPQTAVVSSFDDYVELCLEAEIVSQATLAKMSEAGGELVAKIQIEQISPEQALKLKNWLVEQQTGVMQGLFSHMLNELKLSETLEFAVKVPAKPKKAQARIKKPNRKTSRKGSQNKTPKTNNVSSPIPLPKKGE